MRQKNSSHSGPPRFLWILLLAVVCIAGTEIAASYFCSPELFQKVAGPVKRGAQVVSDFVVETAETVKDHVSDAAVQLTAYVDEQWDDWQKAREEKAAQKARENQEQEAADPICLPQLPIADPAITELESAGGREYLTGGTQIVEYFQQSSPVWTDQPYGSDDIGTYGCGPTAMAMAVSTMTDTEINPAEMAQWSVKNGHWAKHGGSYLSLINDAAESFGLTSVSIQDRTPEALQDVLFSGGMIVALMGPGHFTSGGHFILIRGVTLEGTMLVADPNSLERSLMEWDPQLLLDELSTNAQSGGPLWALYPN